MSTLGSIGQHILAFNFGTWNEPDKFAKEYKALKGKDLNIWSKSKQAYQSAVKPDLKVIDSLKNGAGRTALWNDIKGATGRGGNYLLKGQFKSFGKGLMKRMPLIGNAMVVAMEAPRVFNSFKDYGVGEGLKQTARTGIELGGFAAGAAAGAAIGSAVPIIGTIIGGIVGGAVAAFAGKKIFGKSKVEKQQELQAQYEQQGVQLSKEQAVAMVKQGATAPVGVDSQIQGQPSFNGGFQGNPFNQMNPAYAMAGGYNQMGMNPYSGGQILFGDEQFINNFTTLPV